MPTNARISRRQFLMGCSAAIAALAGSRLTHLAFADPEAAEGYNDEILVAVFLRGGWDALNVAPPIAGDDRGYYEAARNYLKVPVASALPLNAQIGLHPSLAPLHSLYQGGQLAVVHAVGLQEDTRSHFDAMNYMEMGTPGIKTTGTGWITRHLQSAPNLPPSILLPALSAGSGQTVSLLGSSEAAALTSPSGFSISSHWKWGDPQRASLRRLYAGDHWLYEAATRTLNTLDVIETAGAGSYTPANGAVYPSGSFGSNLQAIAQMIKSDLGLRAATIDLGGWDTHEGQGDGAGGYLATNLLTPLAQGLAAFYADLDGAGAQDYASRLTLVVMSEFGRRLRENANRGTDHGHGSAMLVLGGSVNGGQVYGQWPGLRNDQLYDGADLAVTTDYRRVLSEILIRRTGNPNLGVVFPGYEGYAPMGIVQGPDLTPVNDYNLYLPYVQR